MINRNNIARNMILAALSFPAMLFAQGSATDISMQNAKDVETKLYFNADPAQGIVGEIKAGASEFKTSKSNQLVDTIGSCDVCKDVPKGVFCDDFCGTELDLTKWWYGRNHWGNGKTFKNHGVAPENVIVKNNKAYFGANGDNYSGPIKGITKSKGSFAQDAPGTRVGGILITDEYIGSGRYEVRMKLPPKLGVCSAIWTFHYQEVYQDNPSYQDLINKGYDAQGNDNDGRYVTVNHEIDIEIPSAPKTGDQYKDCSYDYARLNTWHTEVNYTDNFQHMGMNQSDGNFHTYRFDWHTGGGAEKARVDFYLDDKFIYTTTEHIPDIKGRLTLGTWFPEWAGGKADFDRIFLEIDWVKVTPFNEPNDKSIRETFKNSGLTKCKNKADNDKFLGKCKISQF
ncbi:MAG: Vibrio phage vB VpaS [Bacteroidota bacterium]